MTYYLSTKLDVPQRISKAFFEFVHTFFYVLKTQWFV